MRALLWIPALVVGCVPPCDFGECEPPRCGPEPQARLTRGDAPDVPWSDGDGIVMVHGPQGGWHLSLGVQVVDPDPFVLVDIVVEAEGTIVVDNAYELSLAEHDGCTGVREDLYGFLGVQDLGDGPEATPPALLSGRPLDVTLDVWTSTGTASDAVQLIGVPDPRDVDE